MRLKILDINSGNLKSVENFFNKNFNYTIEISDYQNMNLVDGDLLVVPGVGNFGHVGKIINDFDGGDKIKKFYKSGKILIGICLGAQLFTEKSEESLGTNGLGLIKGECKNLVKHSSYVGRIPRVGWSGLKNPKYEKHSLYFVHSFYINANESDLNSKVEFCTDGVTAMIEKENLLAMQFHPEKSNGSGYQIVKEFIDKNV